MTRVEPKGRKAGRDRPVHDIEITEEMITEGVIALGEACPTDVAFPAGGEEIAVAAVLKAALAVRHL